MKSIKFKLLSATIALIFVATAAVSQEGMGGPHGGGGLLGHEFGFFADYLDLTDAQRTQMKQTLAAEKPTLKPLIQQEVQYHQQMLQLIQSSSFDETKAQAIATQESQTHIQLEVQKARIHSELYQQLTADQKTKLAQFLAKHEQRMQQHLQQNSPAQ
ncbi:MAG: periplasmic repressor CpxP [Acidobacteriaceae bacterium]|nr:periplasmic repressor CpxP [Acidobacteriaceae bacterium]